MVRMRSPVRLWLAAPKRSTSFLRSASFCVCVHRTQHRLTACGQHHFERSENIVINKRTQNDVTAEAVNGVASPQLHTRLMPFAVKEDNKK